MARFDALWELILLQLNCLSYTYNDALWELILLQLNCLSYTYKPVSLDFGL